MPNSASSSTVRCLWRELRRVMSRPGPDTLLGKHTTPHCRRGEGTGLRPRSPNHSPHHPSHHHWFWCQSRSLVTQEHPHNHVRVGSGVSRILRVQVHVGRDQNTTAPAPAATPPITPTSNAPANTRATPTAPSAVATTVTLAIAHPVEVVYGTVVEPGMTSGHTGALPVSAMLFTTGSSEKPISSSDPWNHSLARPLAQCAPTA